ncbi:lanthionine synthetase LanC family protein [Mucilaginibacter sp. PAMB04168]|uniref:lanthionine synthetase LanC family protein n=1 Tax=Mucilaginibacter sp. PAMB04168 TaxID=3138567 RepID=UPI0031F6AAC8
MEPSLLNRQTGNAVCGVNTIYSSSQILDYDCYLNNFSLDYKHEGSYIVVGNTPPASGWVIYLSVIRQQMSLFMVECLETLVKFKSSFILPANSTTHTLILDGGFGYSEIGKVITIYPHSQEDAAVIAGQLIELTKGFVGPEIPAAFHLRGIVYAGVKEEQSVNLKWPFDLITRRLSPKKIKWLKGYFIVHLLKGDAKGSVYKCLNVKTWTDVHWCLIKQGLAYQCSDDHGRNIRHRLEWQHELLKKLQGAIPLPKPLEYFEWQGNAYLVTEFVSGQNINETIIATQAGLVWLSMPVLPKRQLIKILLAIIEIINQFHISGLVHRDINPGNFLIRENGEIIAIDIELVYDYCSGKPDPAFAYGTPGYISPQQQRQEIPCVQDDIYGLGGLMIKVFTGLSPTKFLKADSEMLFENLTFFTGNERVAFMICSCLEEDSTMRPDIRSIKHTLEVYDALLLTEASNHKLRAESETRVNINDIIQKAINGLNLPQLRNAMGYWVSRNTRSADQILNEFKFSESSLGFANGVSGIIYVLAKADKSGFDITGLHDLIYHNYKLLDTNSDTGIVDYGDYFFGAAGITVGINAMIASGLLENSVNNNNMIYRALNGTVSGLSIAAGLAGKGLAILNCQSGSKLPNLYAMVSAIVGTIIKEQKPDGSWDIREDESQKKGIKLYSLSYGIAGVIYFLLAYYEKYEDTKVRSAIIKSLYWLKRQRKNIDGKPLWPVSNKNRSVDPWFEFGFTGVALTYIKAYQVLKIQDYKDVAASALHHHPKNISSNYITYANGLSGLGDVFLYAYRVFGDEDWLNRAGHIANLLCHLFRQPDDNSIYWLESNHTDPASDLMAGNAGIIHFLIGYADHERIRTLL